MQIQAGERPGRYSDIEAERYARAPVRNAGERRRRRGAQQVRTRPIDNTHAAMTALAWPLRRRSERTSANALEGIANPPLARVPCGNLESAMTVKEQLHQVIDGMSDPEAAGLLRLIAAPAVGDDAMATYLAAAPPDDEPLTAEDLDAAREALGDLAAGRLVDLDELARELG